MAKCPGCNAEIGCSCNIKKASDGTQRCGACLYTYEQSLQTKNSAPPVREEQTTNQPQSYQVQAPVINSITHNYNNYNS